MGRPRSAEQERPQQPRTNAQAVVAVALVQAAEESEEAFVAALAPLLLAFVPLELLARTEATTDIVVEAAKLLYEADAVPVASTGFARTAALEAISYRAAYAEAAVVRLCGAVVDAESGDKGTALGKALEAERRRLASHVGMTGRRLAGARATEAMVELHGGVLNWAHGVTGTPVEFRPTHKAADGFNVDLGRGVPASLMALPGVLAGCSCAWRPPRPNARMLV